MAPRPRALSVLAHAATTVVVAVVMLWTSIAGATARCDTERPMQGCCCAKSTGDESTPTDRASRVRDPGCCQAAPVEAPPAAALADGARDLEAALSIVDPGSVVPAPPALGPEPRIGLARGPPLGPTVPLFVRHCAYLV